MEFDIKSKVNMVDTFSVIGFLVLLVFGVDNIFLQHSFLLGFAEIVLSGTLLLNFVILRFTDDAKTTSILAVTVLFLALILMYISGGISGNTGVFWYFTFPIVSIFLLGQKKGLILNITLLSITYLLYFLKLTPFDFIETRQLSIAMVVVTLLVVVYWRANKSVEDVLNKKSDELAKSLETIKENTVEEKDRNEYLEKSKKAMVNLLEDAKELETKLREEKDFSEKIISLMGEGLIMVDNDYNLVLANNAAKNILGLKESDIGRYLPDFLRVVGKGKELPKDQRPLLVTLKSGKSIKVTLEDDYSVIIGNKSIPISLVTTPIEVNGKITGALVNFHDLTKDKEVKTRIEQEVKDRTKELSEEKAKLLSSIEALTKAFIMVDTNSKVILTNKNLGNIFDSSKKSWELGDIQKKLGESFNLIEAYEKNLKTKSREAYQITWGTKYLEIRLSPVFENAQRSKDGGIIGTLIIIGDVTEAKILERSKDEFFSIASHELRTPLTAIRGNASLIKEFFSHRLKDKELLEMIDDIEESSIRLIDIVNDFLNMGRLEQGRLSFKLEDFDLNSLIKDSLKQYQVTGSRQKLSLNYKLGSKPIMVRADKDGTRQTLINLIGNGLKFTEKGGVTVSVKKDNISACCYIKDTGRGIPVENQKLLFRKFQQAGSSIYTRDTTKGTGLGLYISKLMVEGMNGRIWLDSSQEGRGSTFAFCLPLSKSKDK